MIILLILSIILFCTIVFTAIKLSLMHNKALNEVLQVLDDHKIFDKN
jgi:hypothetical protein